jgi:hypothetical protein
MNLAISTFFSLASGRLNTSKIHLFLAKRRPLEKPWKQASRERDEAVNQAGRQAGRRQRLVFGPNVGFRHYVLFLRQNGPCLALPKVENPVYSLKPHKK